MYPQRQTIIVVKKTKDEQLSSGIKPEIFMLLGRSPTHSSTVWPLCAS